MTMRQFNPHITCAFLYIITRYGYPPPATGTARYVRLMAGLGFRSVELEGIGPGHLSQVGGMRDEVLQALTEEGVSLPVFCTVLPGLGSPDVRRREESLEAFDHGCELARYLGAGGVLDNGPLVPYVFPDDMPIHRHYSQEVLCRAGLPEKFDWGIYYEGLVGTMRTACDIAASYGLDYYLHPCSGSLTESVDSFLMLYGAVGRGNLKFNFDTANQYFTRENLVLGLTKLAGRLDYIHISDNRGQKMEHLPGGEGGIDWGQFFATLKATGFDGQLSIDVGGAETGVEDIDKAYTGTAHWLENQIADHRLFER